MSRRHDPDDRDQPEPTGPDWILPVAAAAFAIYYLISISSLRLEAKISGLFVAAILGLLLIAFAVRTALRLRSGRAVVSFAGTFARPDGLLRQGLLVLFILGFINLVSVLGFTLGVFAFLFLSLLTIARLDLRKSATIAGITALGGYLLFIVALQTQFPDGPFERTLTPAVDALRQLFAEA